MPATARRLAPVPSPPPAGRAATISRFRRRYANIGTERTAEIYSWAADRLDVWLTAVGDEREFTELDADAIDDFLGAFAKGRDGFTVHSASYVNQIYRSLRVFFGWLGDRYGTADPMGAVPARMVGEHRIEDKVLTDEQLRAIIDTVRHNRRDFTAIRDHALLRLLLTGVRRGELVGLTVDDVDLDNGLVRVRGKGDAGGERTRYVPFGVDTAEAIDDYLERRARHTLADRRELWVGKRGSLTGRGLHMIVGKRGDQAGIAGVHPHMFRHTAADRWLTDGGNEGHLMENMGWKSRAMVDHYAKATRAKRAREEYRRRGLDDRI